MNLKNKIFLIFLFLLLFLIIFNVNNVFASFDFTYNETSYSLPNLPFDSIEHPDYVIVDNYKDEYIQIAYPKVDYQIPFYYSTISSSQQGIQYWKSDDTERVPIGHNSGGAGVQWCYYNLNYGSTVWSEMKTTGANQIKTKNNEDCSYVIYSTCNIINTDGTIFFRGTPVAIIPVLETAEQIPMAMVETMKVIIPVGLVLLSTVLIIYLIRWVVLRHQ